MYILPTLTYLEVVVPADASKFFIFEHFKWEPISPGIYATATPQKILSIWPKRSRRDTSKSEVFSVLGALRCTQKLPRRQARMGRCGYMLALRQHSWLFGLG